MKFGSLFAGIGGIDLGLERAGMECAWQVEIDDYCNRVLEKHWPDVPRYGNVRDVGRHNLETVDLIAGGFPCQPHSVAGKRRGAEDDRNLWPEFSRVIEELRPRYVLAENVPGIVTTYIDTVLSDLESQAYTCTTFNIPACAFDAPHIRKRIFIVGYSKQVGWRQRANEPRTSRNRETPDFPSNASESSIIMANSSPLFGPEIKRNEQDRVLSEVLADTTSYISGNDSEDKRTSDRESNPSTNTSSSSREQSWWTVEPNVGRVAHGVPSRVDRLRALGNAVVPQVAEWIGKRIMEFDEII